MRARYPDQDGFVERDGLKIAYEVYGDGDRTVVLRPDRPDRALAGLEGADPVPVPVRAGGGDRPARATAARTGRTTRR